MNAAGVLTDNMTLEEKLAAIDKLVASGTEEYRKKNGLSPTAPVDPAELTMCEGCQ